MRGVRIRWGSRLTTTFVAVALVAAVIGPAPHRVAAQVVCVDSPFLGFFDEDEDGVLSLDEVLAVSDANAQLADIAGEMQERGITGFRYADCEPETVPTGVPNDAAEPAAAPTAVPETPVSTSPAEQATAASDPAAAPQLIEDEDPGPLVVTTLPGVGHGPPTSPFIATIAGVVATAPSMLALALYGICPVAP